MHPVIKIILLVIIPIAEVLVIYFLNKIYKKRRLIRKTETAHIGFIQKGFYEVKGKIKSMSENLVSPLSGKSCVYYNFVVKELKGSGKSSRWVKIIEDERYNKFLIEDQTGQAIIKILDSKTDFKLDKKTQSGMLEKATQEMKSALRKYNKSNEGFLFDKSMSYRETYLEEGDELYVLGEVQEFENYKPVFASGKVPLIVSDKSEKELKEEAIVELVVLFIIAIVLVILELFIIFKV